MRGRIQKLQALFRKLAHDVSLLSNVETRLVIVLFQKEFCIKCLSKDMSADGSQFQQNLKIQIQAKIVEGYN